MCLQDDGLLTAYTHFFPFSGFGLDSIEEMGGCLVGLGRTWKLGNGGNEEKRLYGAMRCYFLREEE